MRIVHILTRLLRAGSEENTLLTCSGQLEHGHEVYLLFGHDSAPEPVKRALPDLGFVAIPALTRELSPLKDASAFSQIRKVLKDIAPDVVHTHQSKAGIVGRFAAAAAGVPLVVHGVHILPFLGESGARKAIYLASERAAARVTDGFIHVSDGIRKSCLAHKVGTDRPHHVVRSGFDLDRFANAERPADWPELVAPAAESRDPLVVSMLSALEPRKNHLALLDHLGPLFGRLPETRVLFAGEGHLREQIAARLRDLGLQNRVRLLGYRDDPERIIALSDICLHCAEREGLPRSVLQYIAGGRPVVLFDLPGIDDVLQDGQNAVIVPAADWTALIDALVRLLEDPVARAHLASGARRTDLSRWDAATMGRDTIAIYHELLENKLRQPRVA